MPNFNVTTPAANSPQPTGAITVDGNMANVPSGHTITQVYATWRNPNDVPANGGIPSSGTYLIHDVTGGGTRWYFPAVVRGAGQTRLLIWWDRKQTEGITDITVTEAQGGQG